MIYIFIEIGHFGAWRGSICGISTFLNCSCYISICVSFPQVLSPSSSCVMAVCPITSSTQMCMQILYAYTWPFRGSFVIPWYSGYLYCQKLLPVVLSNGCCCCPISKKQALRPLPIIQLGSWYSQSMVGTSSFVCLIFSIWYRILGWNAVYVSRPDASHKVLCICIVSNGVHFCAWYKIWKVGMNVECIFVQCSVH